MGHIGCGWVDDFISCIYVKINIKNKSGHDLARAPKRNVYRAMAWRWGDDHTAATVTAVADQFSYRSTYVTTVVTMSAVVAAMSLIAAASSR